MGPQGASALASSSEHIFTFASAERARLDALTTETLDVEPRRKLIDAGRPCLKLFLLKTGWLIDFKLLKNGRRQILAFHLPGDLVGIECLAYPAALHSTAALTPCTVALFSTTAFGTLFAERPRLASALLSASVREGAILHEWEVSLGRRSAPTRVAHLLLELHHRLRLRGLNHDHSVPFPLTQEDIADCTGLTPPYVNRVIQQMRRAGLISLDAQVLRIHDAVALAKVASFSADYLDES